MSWTHISFLFVVNVMKPLIKLSIDIRKADREADGARLLSECGGYTPPRVRIPLSPPYRKRLVGLPTSLFCCLLSGAGKLFRTVRPIRSVVNAPARMFNFDSFVPYPSLFRHACLTKTVKQVFCLLQLCHG